MIPIYTSNKTTVKLTKTGTIVKTTINATNKNEHSIQTFAHKLGVAPAVISQTFDTKNKKLTMEMEYIDGKTLDEYIKEPNINKNLIKHLIFSSINLLYNNGINHKDLSSKNILIVTGSKIEIKILDYGNAVITNTPTEIRLRDYAVLKNW